MCRFERYTARRGTSAAPRIRFRTRRGRRTPGRPSRALCIKRAPLGRSASGHRPLGGLAGLLPHVLALVADTLALVRLGLPNLSHVGGDLADELLVDALHHDAVRGGDLELDPVGWNHGHGVREANLELQVRLLQGGPVPDALDLQPFLVALGHTLHHVGYQRPGQPVERAVLPLVRGTLHPDLAVLDRDLHVPVDPLAELTARPLDGDHAVTHLDGDAVGDGDGLFPDPAHHRPPTTRGIGPRRRHRGGRPAYRSSVPARWRGWRSPARRAREATGPGPRRHGGPDATPA